MDIYHIPKDAWYIDSSSRENPSHWTAVALQPRTDTMWFETCWGGVIKTANGLN